MWRWRKAGSVLFDCHGDRVLYEETVPLPHIRRLFEEAQKAGLYIQTYDQTDILTERKTRELEYYSDRQGEPAETGGVSKGKRMLDKRYFRQLFFQQYIPGVLSHRSE